MTTIAWDGTTLATDSQGNQGDYTAGAHVKKLFKNVGPFQAVALCGEIGGLATVIECMKSGDEEQQQAVPVAGVVIDRKGQAWDFDGSIWSFSKVKPPSAHGSGWALATAAMRGGADADQALRITSKLCLYTGGRIQKYVVK